jgi:hypothetical protein
MYLFTKSLLTLQPGSRGLPPQITLITATKIDRIRYGGFPVPLLFFNGIQSGVSLGEKTSTRTCSDLAHRSTAIGGPLGGIGRIAANMAFGATETAGISAASPVDRTPSDRK